MTNLPSDSLPKNALEPRKYLRKDCVVFRKTKESFGGLSNMASGFPLKVNGVRILTSEALYQACRFPHRPEIQELIIAQHSPMTAKMVGKPHRWDTRHDWDRVRVKIMYWCLKVKLAEHWSEFGALLLDSGCRPIVEESRKDDFWGAKAVDEETLVGVNVLGRLLMKLREELKGPNKDALKRVDPLGIPEFLLYGKSIGVIELAMKSPEKSFDLFGNPIKVNIEQTDEAASKEVQDSRDLVLEPGNSTELLPPKAELNRKMVTQTKKLIEVALPLEAINKASAREKSIRHGQPILDRRSGLLDPGQASVAHLLQMLGHQAGNGMVLGF